MEQALFQNLLLAELDALWRFARHLTGHEHHANDLVQGACLKALENADTFSPKGNGMRSWLFRIAHNQWRNQKRNLRRETQADPEYPLEEALVAPASNPASMLDLGVLDFEQMDQRLKNAMEALPENYRVPLVLWAIEDMPYREIAEVLDIPLGTVMSRLHRARAQLSVELEGLARDTGHWPAGNKTSAQRVVEKETP